ncbi:MAG: kelch repeat-containing protein [Myxococcales bacterium]|nr:kelch repeat-containing protein [Myxococcales bacterium]
MTMRLLGLCCLMAACGPVPMRADGGAAGGTSLLTGGGFGGSSGGGFGGSSGGGSTGGGNVGGGSAGGSATGGGTATCTPGGALQLQQLHGAFAAYTPGGTAFRGGFDSATRQAFMLPLSVTPTLRTLHTVRLDGDGSTLRDGGSRAFVEALPLSGTIPTGNLTATAFDEQTSVLTGLYFSKAPNRYEVAQLTVSDGGARFTTLTSFDSPDANGFLYQNLEGTSAQLGAIGGNAVVPLTITGTQAQWGMAVSGQPYSNATVYDRDANRVLSLGSYEFVPPMGARWLPTIQERSPTAANWTPIAMSGTGLPSVEPGLPTPYPFMAWDAVGGRLLVTGTRPEMFGNMTIMVPTVVEADLRTRQWRVLPNSISSILGRAPFITDRDFRQMFGPDFVALSLAPGREFSQTSLKLTGALPPNSLSALSNGARLPDGRVMVAANQTLLTFDPATTRWTTLTARLPMTQSSGVTMAFDPVGQRTLLLFGQNGSTSSAEVSAVSADGTTTTPVATTGTRPPGRWSAAALVVGTTLFIAGGVAGTQALGDVYALDLTSLVWRKVADVTPRQQPALTLVDGAMFIVGGRTAAVSFVPTIERVDLTTNQVRTVAATGPAPTGYATFAPLGNGLVGFDIGMSYDFGSDQLFELKLENNTAVWTNSDPRAMDLAISPLIGVAGANCNEALFVGSSSFKVSR